MKKSQIIQAIYELYPQVKSTVEDKAFDENGNEIAYDLNLVTNKALEDEQAAKDAKDSALAKLAKLGLTEDEVKALIG